jgi:hypothetical protein
MKRGLACVAFLLLGSHTPAARAEPPAPVSVQTIALGDVHVQSHLPVALVVDPQVQRRAADTLSELAGGPASAPVTMATTDSSAEIVWRPGTQEERVLQLGPGAVLLPVTPHRTETYSYFVRLRDHKQRFEVRLPAAPAVFRIQVEAAAGPSVVEGTGDREAPHGERIPIQVRIAHPSSVREVVLFHRSSPTSPWVSSPMDVSARSETDGTWAGSVQRPLGREEELEYYVQAIGTDGRVTHYGLSARPHRLKLTSPFLPGEVEQ